jgi:PncC family amidohydrolase
VTRAGLVERIAARLTAARQTLATVECSLAGALGDALTDVPGASAWYLGGVAPYSTKAKELFLGLGPDAFAGHGAVSPAAAIALAEAIRSRLGADWALAETGLLGPRGAHRSAKEPGTAYLALIGPDGRVRERAVSTRLDDRRANKDAFLDAAVELLYATISTDFEALVV